MVMANGPIRYKNAHRRFENCNYNNRATNSSLLQEYPFHFDVNLCLQFGLWGKDYMLDFDTRPTLTT